MNKYKVNIGLNKLKDKYPDKLVMIESLQRSFNKDVQCIDKANLRALYQNPAQFMVRVDTDDGEWTTMLHKWADNGLEDLLDIDPIYLLAKNSLGDTVLMNMVAYALGNTTEQINYDLLKKIMEHPMDYRYKTGNGDEMLDGCVWDEKDITGKTPIDYIKDMAIGRGACENCAPISDLIPLLTEWSNRRMDAINAKNAEMAQMSEESENIEGDGCVDDVEDMPPADYEEMMQSQESEGVTASDIIDNAVENPDEDVEDMPEDYTLDDAEVNRAEQMTKDTIKKSPELNGESGVFNGIK